MPWVPIFVVHRPVSPILGAVAATSALCFFALALLKPLDEALVKEPSEASMRRLSAG